MAATLSKITVEDFDDFITLIHALADFEKLDPPAPDAIERLYHDAFSETPRYEGFLVRNDAGVNIGYCIIFETYSSFLAKPTLYLEDIFIMPEHRRLGYAHDTMKALAKIAVSRNCGRMEWQVLDWNENAIAFYQKIGAVHQNEWHFYRLAEQQLHQLVGTHE
ncbi:MAG: GNAT family N-acetyltransferase [Candidatus Kapabacteria bacterium]|nr:GNAT family N-acetyltransferase [Candidatus Kapabacteria bacterium]